MAVERNGRWGKVTAVPGLAALTKGSRPTMVNSVSCTQAGRCAVGGFYTDRSGHSQGFVTSEHNDRWGTPIPLPGLAALNTRGSVAVSSVWCGPVGSCAVGGSTPTAPDTAGIRHSAVVSEGHLPSAHTLETVGDVG